MENVAIGPRGHVMNHQINPATGFLENPGYAFDFDSERKQAFIDEYRRSGLRFRQTCKNLGISPHTIHKHTRIDQAFKNALDEALADYAEHLESSQMEFALDKKNFMDRAMQLRRLYPEKYALEKTLKTDFTITLNTGNAASLVDQTKTIDAELVTNDSNALSNALANPPTSDGGR